MDSLGMVAGEVHLFPRDFVLVTPVGWIFIAIRTRLVMLKKRNDSPYLGLIVGVIVFGFLGLLVAVYNWGRESASNTIEAKETSAISEKDRASVSDYAERYARDPHQTIFENCLDRLPKDDEIGDTYRLKRRMRFAKSAYDWSYIEMETDVATDKKWFETAFTHWIGDSPFPYVKGKPGELGKLATFYDWSEEDKYKPGTDGRIEWLVTPKVEFGRKTLTLKFRCLR